MGNEDESERERGGNIPGQELIGVDRSCVRTGSDRELDYGTDKDVEVRPPWSSNLPMLTRDVV